MTEPNPTDVQVLTEYEAAVREMYELEGYHTGHGVGKVATHRERIQQALVVREARRKLVEALQQSRI